MDLTKYPIPHAQAAARVVDGEAVIVLADTGEVNVLNAVGTRIWELMDGTRSVQQIAEVIQQEFDVSLQTAVQDAEQIIQQLTENQAIVLEDQPHPNRSTNTP
jgi:hypothetical protein